MGRRVDITDGRTDRTKAAPLIVAMHGFLGTSRSMRKKAGFDALAKKHGFIVAYPNGKKRRWNDGRSASAGVDDVGYLVDFITALVRDGRVDPAKVFLAGHSNGGGMAMRFACDRPDLIAGIAVIATKIPTAYQCRQGRPVPAIFFHGTLDPIAPHEGRPQGSRLGATLSAADTLRVWASRNRCEGIARTQTIDRRNDGTSADLIAYAGCRAALWQVLIDGHGHDWPGNGRGATRLQGPATKEVAAGQLSWRFFDRL
ncbi:MAG: alpha/beta fold hydrolase [Silicimonas sp.]|nr:alpha/beta fold hydrolase [Silicimonas sp.]